ncbi:MAG TPA: ABC transporter permease [Beutenbergiaceae bacterium]|nr:ABC transporter permease [Beutenbergiaceae bacterium]
MQYLLSRLGQAATVLLVAFTAAFLLLQAMPADALMIRFESPELGLSPQQIADLRIAYGVDAPLHVQYWHSLSGVLRGDLGYSIESGTAVRTILADALPRTLTLAGLSLLLAVLVAFAIAFAASLSRFTWLRSALRAAPSLFVSVPVFWLGIVLIQVFSFRLGWVPVINPGPVEGLILPVLTLAVPISAPLAQILVRSMDAVSLQPFVTVTRAKGASELWTQWHAVLRNAVLPAMTMAGVLFGELIAGAVVTETVFARAGIGRITEQAVRTQDIPVLQGVVLMAAAVFVAINLSVDLLYPRVDPRLRGERRLHGKAAAAR